jgi:hyperosmotically inducible periplasmic protein
LLPTGNGAASPRISELPFITLLRSLQAMRNPYLSTLVTTGSLALAMGSAFADDVKSDQPVKDSYITTKVKAELAKDKGTSATSIHVTTKDGVVMLDGTVASQAEKELAEKDAKRVKGVVSVHNGLDVK